MLKFSVQANSENDTKTVVRARDFKIIVDEPANLGGSDDGANPVEYILAAFCGCLNVVGHIIAKEMDFVLKGLSIEIEGDLDPTKFMGIPTQGRAGYTEIRVKLIPECEVPLSTLKQWKKRIEERCPVSDNIANATPVTIDLG